MAEQVISMRGAQRKALNEVLEPREPKEIEDRHYRRELVVRLGQDERGNWRTFINGAAGIPASDVEIVLWQELQKRVRLDAKNNGSPLHPLRGLQGDEAS